MAAAFVVGATHKPKAKAHSERGRIVFFIVGMTPVRPIVDDSFGQGS
jgi:hypothetical protein